MARHGEDRRRGQERIMTTQIHNSSTCSLNAGGPCDLCSAANAYEQRQSLRLTEREFIALAAPVLERARADLNDGERLTKHKCNCDLHRLSQSEPTARIDAAIELTLAEIAIADFDDDWELAPLSMTRTTERECAEYWYEQGRRAKDHQANAEHAAAFDPTTCAELVREVLRLREKLTKTTREARRLGALAEQRR